MHFLSTIAVAALAASLVAAIEKPPKLNGAIIESEFVKVLSKDNFEDEVLKGNAITLVEFFAPWCGHCKTLAPELVAAAEALKSEKDVKIAQVDCTQHQDLCKDVRAYPTMKIYKNGNFSDYTGDRKSDGIIKYLKKQIQPAITTLTGDKVSAFTKSDKVVIVSYLQPGSAEEKEFAKVADKFRNDFSFGSVKAPSVIMFKQFDEGYAAFDGKITEEALTEFLQTESVPLMAEIGPDNYMKYFDSKLPLAYFFYGDDEQKTKLGPQIEAAIKEFKGKINAVYIKASQFGQHADSLNLPKEWPGFVVHFIEKDHKFPFTEKEITKESINKFVGGVLSGDIKPTFKTEAIPEKDNGPVKTLVHDNFEKVVFDGKKDVLVEFYAPWCGACKNLEPIYEKLATKYSKVKGGDSLIIAKMNAVANDLPSSLKFELRAYPTIKFFKAGSKEPVDYEGEHSLKTFVEFLNANSSKLKSVVLEKAEIEEEEARQQKAKEAKEKAQKAQQEATQKKKDASSSEKSEEEAIEAGEHEEL